MQTQEQAAALIQADAAQVLRQPKPKKKAAPGIQLNPSLSGSDQVAILAQAGAAGVAQPQSRGRSIEQMAMGGGDSS